LGGDDRLESQVNTGDSHPREEAQDRAEGHFRETGTVKGSIDFISHGRSYKWGRKNPKSGCRKRPNLGFVRRAWRDCSWAAPPARIRLPSLHWRQLCDL